MGLGVLLCVTGLAQEAFSLSWRHGSGPTLEFDADELPDVVDSVSALAVTIALGVKVPPVLLLRGLVESHCERKPRLQKKQTVIAPTHKRHYSTGFIGSNQL